MKIKGKEDCGIKTEISNYVNESKRRKEKKK